MRFNLIFLQTANRVINSQVIRASIGKRKSCCNRKWASSIEELQCEEGGCYDVEN